MRSNSLGVLKARSDREGGWRSTIETISRLVAGEMVRSRRAFHRAPRRTPDVRLAVENQEPILATVLHVSVAKYGDRIPTANGHLESRVVLYEMLAGCAPFHR